MSSEDLIIETTTTIVISEATLGAYKKSGHRLRFNCPIHQGDSQTLSLQPWCEQVDEDDAWRAGWGHCHNSTCAGNRKPVLVKEWNPRAARRLLNVEIEERRPRITSTTDQMKEAERWQIEELQALNKLYDVMCEKLTSHARSVAYLAGRGIQGDMLSFVASLGIGYIPPASEWKVAPSEMLNRWKFERTWVLENWCDRIIFPFTTSDGKRGFVGRSLHLWQPGMDENEHKHLLDAHDDEMKYSGKYPVKRWRKTLKSGFFNASAIHEHGHLFLCEGPFDALPLLYAGASDVIAVAGTHIEVAAIPAKVQRVTVAFDADVSIEKIAALDEQFGYFGIQPLFFIAPDDGMGKDWSERYRKHGKAGLEVLFNASSVIMSRDAIPDVTSSVETTTEQEETELIIPEQCADCHTPLTEDRDFNFIQISSDQVVCYCNLCRDEQGRPLQSPVKEQVQA
jgi:hypothetical protein